MAESIHPDPMSNVGRLADAATGLLSLLCLEAHALAERHGVDTIHFLTREGIFFQRFFDAFAKGANWKTRSALFHASRLSTFAASLTADGPAGLRRLVSQYQTVGWEQVLRSLDAWPPPTTVAGIIRQPAKATLMGNALQHAAESDPVLAAWLQSLAGQRRRDLSAYMARHHPALQEAHNAVLVDIGWRGTIQDNLALIVPGIHWHGLYLGLFPYLNPQPANSDKYGIMFVNGMSDAGPVDGNVMVIEYLFHAGVGSVTGYHASEPAHAADGSGNVMDFAGRFQSELLAHATSLGVMLANAAQAPERERLLANWRRDAAAFVRNCQAVGPELFDAIRRFRHDEAFGLGRTVQIDDVLSLRSMFGGVFSRRTRDLFIQHSLAIPPDLRRSIKLGWWVWLWFVLHAAVDRLKRLLRRKE